MSDKLATGTLVRINETGELGTIKEAHETAEGISYVVTMDERDNRWYYSQRISAVDDTEIKAQVIEALNEHNNLSTVREAFHKAATSQDNLNVTTWIEFMFDRIIFAEEINRLVNRVTAMIINKPIMDWRATLFFAQEQLTNDLSSSVRHPSQSTNPVVNHIRDEQRKALAWFIVDLTGAIADLEDWLRGS